ncbi:unnamed protein product, partial [Symbiodinium microadriaticum]
MERSDLIRGGPNAVETLLDEINGHAIAGDAAAAAAQFHAQAPMPAPRVLWNTVMKAYANAGDLPGAEQWLKEMESANVVPNGKTYGKLMEAAAKAGDPDSAEKWFEHSTHTLGYGSNHTWYGLLMDASAKAGDPQRAARWLAEARRAELAPNLMYYTTLVDSCAKAADLRGLQHWLKEMLKDKLMPNARTLTAIIDGHAKAGD